MLHTPTPTHAAHACRCALEVNHAYKFIFIRNRKAASTSILEALNASCSRSSMAMCLRPLSATSYGPVRQSLSAVPAGAPYVIEDIWAGYFVFSIYRNPWDRAASGYKYILSRWRQGSEDACTPPTFRQFSSDPTILGKMENVFKCSKVRPELCRGF